MRPIQSDRQKLRGHYPTMQKYEEAYLKLGSQTNLADKLNMDVTTLHNHHAWLKRGRLPVAKRGLSRIERSNAEMDAIIKAMGVAEGSPNTVKVFQIVGEYIPGQTGYDGMEFIEERDAGTWSEIKCMPKVASTSTFF